MRCGSSIEPEKRRGRMHARFPPTTCHLPCNSLFSPNASTTFSSLPATIPSCLTLC